MNFMIDSLNLKKTAFDEGSSPQYRTQRNRGGTLPGLAEFQERMQLLEDGLDSNSEVEIYQCIVFSNASILLKIISAKPPPYHISMMQWWRCRETG